MTLRDLIPWKKDNEKKVTVRRESEEPLHALQHNMNRLFDDFFGDFGMTPFGRWGEQTRLFQPQIDISENDKAITVTAELPGLTDEDVEISLDRDVLTISGEKKEEKEDKGDNYYHVERSYGAFRRQISLPTEVVADKVEATFKNGVLTIDLPKSPEAQKRVKHITVKSG